MAIARDLLTLPVTASDTVAGKRFVTQAGAHCGAGAKALGVSRFAATNGKTLGVIVLGTAVVTAGDAIIADADVASDLNGKAVTATEGDVILGRALEDAADEDDDIEVLLTPSGAVVPGAG